MNLKRLLGFDIREDEYAYGRDPRYGFTSAAKIPDRWVPTTCGYCSVGCGMQIGVKDGRAVAARGNEDHPVNRGKLCPKGLAEHDILSVASRAKHPLLKGSKGRFERVGWDRAIETLAGEFRRVQAEHGPAALGVISTGKTFCR